MTRLEGKFPRRTHRNQVFQSLVWFLIEILTFLNKKPHLKNHAFRNHNAAGNPPQDPAMWPTVAAAARKANLFRYRHLPYLFRYPSIRFFPNPIYSLHFSAALKGGTVVRPTFFEFPNDVDTHTLSYQFLWGPAMMIMPVVNQVRWESLQKIFSRMPRPCQDTFRAERRGIRFMTTSMAPKCKPAIRVLRRWLLIWFPFLQEVFEIEGF